ncbi:FkbM family methyltransferase [Confluentibacter sediminis]|uniref:FkbM family methyltransferase n=1 Tax=Confluentibacter sediminis TaxID=2219045 RepID=UPI0013A6FB54|nr:FkbM family methyltransferase [Confluentibacter sediminis]
MFYLPENETHVSGSIKKHNNVAAQKSIKVHIKSFDDIVKILGHPRVNIVKMDIEGAEYGVIESILKAMQK